VSVSASTQKKTYKQKSVFQAAVKGKVKVLATIQSVIPESSLCKILATVLLIAPESSLC
jgi:hypothetical protein